MVCVLAGAEPVPLPLIPLPLGMTEVEVDVGKSVGRLGRRVIENSSDDEGADDAGGVAVGVAEVDSVTLGVGGKIALVTSETIPLRSELIGSRIPPVLDELLLSKLLVELLVTIPVGAMTMPDEVVGMLWEADVLVSGASEVPEVGEMMVAGEGTGRSASSTRCDRALC